MNTEMIFAQNLKNRRKELGLTQKELAERIGYSEKSISKWESGGAVVPSVLLPSLAHLLKTDIDYFFKSTEEPQYFLGVDGGGTKTEFLLCDKNGKEVNRVILSGSNPVDIGFERASEILREGIKGVCGDIPFSVVSAYVGMAGGITGNNRSLISALLRGFGFAAYGNGSDAMNAVAAGLNDEDGVAVILGTGSIAYTKNKDKLTRTGGFGYLLDDGGSGFSIGRDALLFALKAEQEGKEEGKLLQLVKKKLATDSILETLGELYDGGKKGFADFCPTVFEAMRQSDAEARRIIEKNAKSAADLIKTAAEKLNDKKETRIILIGSVAKQQEFLNMLKEYLPKEYRLSLLTEAPVNGAVKLAMKGEINNA